MTLPKQTSPPRWYSGNLEPFFVLDANPHGVALKVGVGPRGHDVKGVEYGIHWGYIVYLIVYRSRLWTL